MKNINEKVRRVTLFIEPDIIRQAKTQAIVGDLSLSSLVENILKKHLPERQVIKKVEITNKS